MKRSVTKYQPTADDREDFDYYWQHLRRNERYQEIAVIDNVLRFTGEQNRSEPLIRNGPRISTERDVQGQHFLIEISGHSRFTRRRIQSQRALIQRMVGKCLLLPELLHPFKFAELEPALHRVLEVRPDFFGSSQWHAIKTKTWGLVAFWNQVGSSGLGWRHYYDPPSTWDKKFPPQQHKPVEDFCHAWLALESAEAWMKRLLNRKPEKANGKFEEQFQLAEKELNSARQCMKAFLGAHPRMDFVLDTSLPWTTVSKALEAEWHKIKALREQVGLSRDLPRKRKRQWRGKLELYDQCLPNRKRYFILRQIWSEDIGFLEALQMLGVKLSEPETVLAQRLDDTGHKPKGFYRTMDRITDRLANNRVPQTDEIGFENDGTPVPLVDFDFEPIYASLDGVEANSIQQPNPNVDVVDLNHINSWRRHFSIQKPKLSTPFAHLNLETRKAWITDACRRIECSWPAKLETEF